MTSLLRNVAALIAAVTILQLAGGLSASAFRV